jgi:hypothetical protein
LVDEVWLDCQDDYASLPEKVQSIFKWAVNHGYDFVMKLDDDSILRPSAWLNSGFEAYDFTGNTILSEKQKGPYVPYGFAYILCRKAMTYVVSAPLPQGNNDEDWVARTLYGHGISLHVDHRYFLHMGRKKNAVRTGPRPLRVFDRPMEREAHSNTFCWNIFLNWEGFHCTPTEEIIKEYYKVWERVK